MGKLTWETAVRYQEQTLKCSLIQHKRNRHGRHQRGPLIVPTLPGWRSLRDQFDELCAGKLSEISRSFPPAGKVQLGIEEVPPSDLAPWERDGVRLAKCFEQERKAGLPARIVLYRLPITRRCPTKENLENLVETLIIDSLANLFAVPPETILGE